MKRRPRRALPAIVVAVVLLAACVVVSSVLIQHLTGTTEFVSCDRIVARLHTVVWDDWWVVVGGVVALVAGFALLMLAILPGRPVVLPLAGDDGFTAGVARRGLRSALQDAAQSVEGVCVARVRLYRKKVRVTIRTGSVHSAGLADRVCAAVADRVALIGPASAPRVVVTASSGRGSTSSAAVRSAASTSRDHRPAVSAIRHVAGSRG